MPGSRNAPGTRGRRRGRKRARHGGGDPRRAVGRHVRRGPPRARSAPGWLASTRRSGTARRQCASWACRRRCTSTRCAAASWRDRRGCGWRTCASTSARRSAAGDELPGQRLDLEDAEDRRSRLRDRRDRLTAEIGEVAAFRAEPPVPRRGDPPRWAPVESILALAGFIESRLALLHQRLRAAEDELDPGGPRRRRPAAPDGRGVKRRGHRPGTAVRHGGRDTRPRHRAGRRGHGRRPYERRPYGRRPGRRGRAANRRRHRGVGVPRARRHLGTRLPVAPGRPHRRRYPRAARRCRPAHRRGLDGRTAGPVHRDLLRRATCRNCARCGSAAASRSRRPRVGARPRPGWRNCSPATTPRRPPSPPRFSRPPWTGSPSARPRNCLPPNAPRCRRRPPHGRGRVRRGAAGRVR